MFKPPYALIDLSSSLYPPLHTAPSLFSPNGSLMSFPPSIRFLWICLVTLDLDL